MPRLILFGCSHTYGHGLPDCVTADDGPGPEPSKLVWGELLGKRFGLDVTNCSFPGASNQLILNTILNFDFLPDDTIVIFWTYFTRGLLYLNEGTRNIGPWNNDDIGRKYYDLHDTNDLYMRGILTIHHAECYLNTRNLNYTHFTLAPEVCPKNIGITGNEPKWFNVNSNPIKFRELYVDIVAGGHPGINTQTNICNYMEKVIINEQNKN